jgi:hypothetical protein
MFNPTKRGGTIMRGFKAAILTSLFLMVTNSAMATQEINDAAVVDYDMNYDEKVCTVIIDRDTPTNASTEKCTQRRFSWKCFNDDYLWHMILHIHKNKLLIDIRYSSDKCFDDKSSNFELLTVW